MSHVRVRVPCARTAETACPKEEAQARPKLPVLKAGKFFECFWCKKEIEYTALRCPFCKKEQDLKLRPMLSKT